MASHKQQVSAELKLVRRGDGMVEIEIHTSEPLQEIRGRPEFGGYVERPVEFLNRMPSSFSLGSVASAARGGTWRYVRVQSEVIVAGSAQALIDRYLDFSAGSEERELFEALAEQPVIRVWWDNEGVQVLRSYPPIERDRWRQALADTLGISPEGWADELAQRAWEESASWRPGPPPRPSKPRRATVPGQPIPFFAKTSGRIPGRGRPEVAGVTLPAGRRYPQRYAASFWCSDEPAPNGLMLASFLANAFHNTGLWPLLWACPEDPDAYMGGHGDVSAVDLVDVLSVMKESWEIKSAAWSDTKPFASGFPGLADGSPAAAVHRDPFAGVPDWSELSRLLLVPCNRPADAITVLGGLSTETPAPVISAVLRSWEQRFGAVPYEVAPSLVKLSVGAPPETMVNALRLAAEQHAFCLREDSGKPAALAMLAGELVGGHWHKGEIRAAVWEIGWYD